MIRIENAKKEHAAVIAELIMEAMNHDCCRWFAGPEHTLEDFRQMMTALVESEGSQYSFRNAFVAMDDAAGPVGVCVSYDGARLHKLRREFIEAAKRELGRDFSDMPDETSAGELYVDSLCVKKEYRGRGIASLLLKAAIRKAREAGLPAGLLVDEGNPGAEKLYRKLGFRHVGNNAWGGHAMRHLVHGESWE